MPRGLVMKICKSLVTTEDCCVAMNETVKRDVIVMQVQSQKKSTEMQLFCRHQLYAYSPFSGGRRKSG